MDNELATWDELATWAHNRIVRGHLTNGRVDPDKCTDKLCFLAEQAADHFREQA